MPAQATFVIHAIGFIVMLGLTGSAVADGADHAPIPGAAWNDTFTSAENDPAISLALDPRMSIRLGVVLDEVTTQDTGASTLDPLGRAKWAIDGWHMGLRFRW